MSIFAAPPDTLSDIDVRVLFLHGLEGSPTGAKAIHLKKKWKAQCPKMRTEPLQKLKSTLINSDWASISKQKIAHALAPAYSDACEAARYFKPDIIVGSSLGGAILSKMVIENIWKGNCVFLAPAIQNILGDINLSPMPASVWILGECDDIVPNYDNIKYAQITSGQLIISPNDGHRLHHALESGLIDAAITTSLEISNHM